MEPQQQQQQTTDVQDQSTGSNSRQTSTRWTPTVDQIRILKELYHNTGLRSPNTEQIQRISARLRQYGKIEGKNVFYWFQNHKARERQQQQTQKMKKGNSGTTGNVLLNDQHRSWRYPCFTAQGYYHASTSASDGPMISANGQLGNHCGYESANMEQHFRGCSISPLASSNGFNGGNLTYNLSNWHYNLFDARKPPNHLEGPEEEYEGGRRTLPLFPMHAEDQRINYQSDGYDLRGGCINGSPFASLELSLNSYTRESRD